MTFLLLFFIYFWTGFPLLPIFVKSQHVIIQVIFSVILCGSLSPVSVPFTSLFRWARWLLMTWTSTLVSINAHFGGFDERSTRNLVCIVLTNISTPQKYVLHNYLAFLICCRIFRFQICSMYTIVTDSLSTPFVAQGILIVTSLSSFFWQVSLNLLLAEWNTFVDGDVYIDGCVCSTADCDDGMIYGNCCCDDVWVTDICLHLLMGCGLKWLWSYDEFDIDK